jgi:hypothetical protein
MKRVKILLLVILSLSLVLTSIFSTTGVSAISSGTDFVGKILSGYFKNDEKEFKAELKKMNEKELITQVNLLSKNLSSSDLIPVATELFSRKDKIGNTDIISTIKDSSINKETKQIMVDLFFAKNEKLTSKNDLKSLLKDNAIDKDVKAKIILTATFDEKDTELLKALINDDDGIVAFNSLKKLSTYNKKEAYKIAETILSNKSSETDLRISAAQKSVAKYLKSSNDDEAKSKFIKQAMKIVEDKTSNPMLKDSSVFAVSNLMSKEAIKTLIENDSVDRVLKVFSIEQNYIVLKEILENKNCTEDDVWIVVEAMEILPIKDLVDSLQRLDWLLTDNLLKGKFNHVLENMKSNGIKATNKWER